MIKTCKKLITDINRNVNTQENLKRYAGLLASRYNCYATVSASMNFFTMQELCLEQEDKNTDVCRYFDLLCKLVNRYVLTEAAVDDKALEEIAQLRHNVEYKMKNLTAYTDGYEVYEYILNRVEGRVKNTAEPVDAKGLSERMFRYVFAESDTVLINSKLQLLLAQLPVRMTRSKFFDVVEGTLNIYEGGEKSSLDEFCDMLCQAVLIEKPKGFDAEYPFLLHTYEDLRQADYENLTEADFDDLSARLSQAAAIINNEASAYLLLQELINGVYVILLTKNCGGGQQDEETGYQAALRIMEACQKEESLEELSDTLTEAFVSMEGVQERVYESITILEAAFEDIKTGKKEEISALGMEELFADLSKVTRLLSTSLFADLTKEYGNGELCDHAYLDEKKKELVSAFSDLFDSVSRRVRRAMMGKLLSSMPIFMNSKQEIQEYFDYVLENCGDDSELCACEKLISEIIEEE